MYPICKSLNLFLKGIGLQRLSLNSDDGDWRDQHFATNLMKICSFIRMLSRFKHSDCVSPKRGCESKARL